MVDATSLSPGSRPGPSALAPQPATPLTEVLGVTHSLLNDVESAVAGLEDKIFGIQPQKNATGMTEQPSLHDLANGAQTRIHDIGARLQNLLGRL